MMPKICSHEEIIQAIYTTCNGSKWHDDSKKHSHNDKWYTKLEWLEHYNNKLSSWNEEQIQIHNDCFEDMPYDKVMDALRIEMTAIKIVGEPPEGSMSLVYDRMIKSYPKDVQFRIEYQRKMPGAPVEMDW